MSAGLSRTNQPMFIDWLMSEHARWRPSFADTYESTIQDRSSLKDQEAFEAEESYAYEEPSRDLTEIFPG